MASVRCLQWWGDSYVLIGCLNGRVCKWKLGDEETEEVSHLDGSVIIMRWNHERTVSLHMFFVHFTVVAVIRTVFFSYLQLDHRLEP